MRFQMRPDVFGVGYLGYTGARSFIDKKALKK